MVDDAELEHEPPVVVLNAMIYPWQRRALRIRQQQLGVLSLSEALRAVLSEALERPEAVEAPEREAA